MSILIMDIATSGLPLRDRGLHAQGQPRIIELAWTVFDSVGARLGEGVALNADEGIYCSKDTLAIHNISDRRRALFGMEMKRILVMFMGHVATSTMLCSYGLKFDTQMLLRELRLAGDDGKRLERGGLRKLCLRQRIADAEATRSMTLPAAHALACGEAYLQTHRAADDRDAAARIFWALAAKGKIET